MSDFREQIELYALGKLSGEALDAFRARLEADPELAAEVSRELELVQAIRASDAVGAFRKQLAAQEAVWAQSAASPRKARMVALRPLLRAAAALLLLVVGALIFWPRGASKSPEQIFAAHFNLAETLENTPLRRDAADNDDKQAASPFFEQLRAAGADLQGGHPSDALDRIGQLKAMPEGAAYADQLAWLAGLAQLQNGDAESAIRELESIRQGFPAQKAWFLALARLKAGRLQEARTGFEAIAGSASPYAEEARAVLEEME